MRVRVLATFATASVLVIGGLTAPTIAQATPSRVALSKSTPSWMAKAHHLGKTADNAGVSFRVYLTPNGGVANLKAAAAAVSTPGSASYRQFISADRYH